MDKLFFIFYSIVKKDVSNTAYNRTLTLMEMFFTLVFLSFSEIIIGLLNIRISGFFYLILLMVPNPILPYFLVKMRFVKFRNLDLFQTYSVNSRKKKMLYTTIALILYFGVFLLLVLCGILMSYLLSLHGKNL